MLRLSAQRFDQLVREALDQLPDEFARQLDNVYVTVEETPSTEDLEAVGMAAHEGDELLGLYHGTALGERGVDYGGALPDRVVLYRRSILIGCETLADARGEILDTLVHELGHHFGLDDDEMPY